MKTHLLLLCCPVRGQAGLGVSRGTTYTASTRDCAHNCKYFLAAKSKQSNKISMLLKLCLLTGVDASRPFLKLVHGRGGWGVAGGAVLSGHPPHRLMHTQAGGLQVLQPGSGNKESQNNTEEVTSSPSCLIGEDFDGKVMSKLILTLEFSRPEYWSGWPFPSLAIFPTQGSNPCLPHCRWILYQLSHKGSPRILERVAYPFSSGSSQPRNRTQVSCIAGGFFTS